MNRLWNAVWRVLPATVVLGLLPAAGPAVAVQPPPGPAALERLLLAKATPDECFVEIGAPYPAGPPCATGQPKVNQAYVWGLAKAGDALWFGTGPNVHCLVSGAFLRMPAPHRNDDWVCEFGQSQLAQRNPSLPGVLGDWRPPHVFVYDLAARALTERTADIQQASTVDARRLATTVGIRSAGAHGGVALLGGPGLQGGVNLFAFDTVTGGYLGSANLAGYNNIRKFLVADGALYAGVGVTGGAGGRVLRWSGTPAAPFEFAEVGNLPSQAAELVVHQGRVFVSTWPAGAAPAAAPAGRAAALAAAPPDPTIAGLWMSPPLAAGEPGLTPADAGAWRQVWSAAQYEPDPLIARTYGGGALASYGGQLYWGTMHVPLLATVAHLTTYPPADQAGALAAVAGTQRAIAVFRGRDLAGPTPRIELLYGRAALPAFSPPGNGTPGAWRLAPTGYEPRFGDSGFGNPFNNYTWTMGVAGGSLYVGTMDWSYLAAKQVPVVLGQLGVRADVTALGRTWRPELLTPRFFGADLWAFPRAGKPAAAVSTAGVGNYLNYGIRTMIPAGPTLYLGMANPMNLRTDPTDRAPEGGWELIQLSGRP